MNKRLNKYLTIRHLKEEDKKDFINLKVKHEDVLELQRCVNIDVKTYLEWHYEHSFEGTHIFIYKGELLGVVGISKDYNLYFFSAKGDKLWDYSITKYFKEVIESLMDEVGTDRAYALLDSQYEVSRDWVLRGGFKVHKKVNIKDNPFEIIMYCRQIDGNRKE